MSADYPEAKVDGAHAYEHGKPHKKRERKENDR